MSAHSKNVGQALWNGTQYIHDPGMSKPRISGKVKEMMDRSLARLIVFHNIPTRFSRYEGFRAFILQLCATCSSRSLYIPCTREELYKYITEDVMEVKMKIKQDLAKAREAYGEIPFLTVMWDGWSSKRGDRFLGVAVNWIDLDSFEQRTALFGVTYVKGEHKAPIICKWVCELFEDFEQPTSSVHLVVTDGAEKASGELFSVKCNSECSTCWDHSLVNCLSYATGKKRYKKPSKASRNNPRGWELINQTRKVCKIFTKSALNTEKLTAIQMARIQSEQHPFANGINTSLRGDNSGYATKEPLSLVLDGETR